MKHLTNAARKHTNTPCPFCALLCDDLTIKHKAGGHLVAEKNACAKAQQEFNRPPHTRTPTIHGQSVSLDKAITHATDILKQAKRPFFAGLGTDVNGMRATLALAERTGGTLDHMNGQAAASHIKVLQDQGWITTTLMEVKNRADLVILAGTDTTDFPRFFERILLSPNMLFGNSATPREVIYIGNQPMPKNIPKLRQINCQPKHIATLISTLNAILNGAPLQAERIAGVPLKNLSSLCDKMRAAQYGVIVWAPADLERKHSEPTIRSICSLINDLNQTTRFAGLPLGGHEGGMTALSVATWQSGYPLKVSYRRGYPEYDPLRFSAERLLAAGETDALVWISSISANRLPPPIESKIPVIALTSSTTTTQPDYSVQIPVGTPGIDHQGQMIRCDSVVSLALHQLRVSGLPSVSSILTAIQHALEARRA